MLIKMGIFAVHLQDNDRSDDLHLIPFDGTIDWKNIIKELKSCNYNGPITLELCYRYGYLEMDIDSFYKKGYEVGEKLKEMFEEEYIKAIKTFSQETINTHELRL